ncbi:MAG: phosphonoacetaldehyde hydrolase [Candidatus Hydrogenedentes bacterium]|nr:phosphonoacetaldehyde hydrolase [Candidatus Hydrogenedentota bacterium]
MIVMASNLSTPQVEAVIFDWAGTTVDFGCCAPAAVFIEVFKRKGVEVTLKQARGPMGMHKRDHIRILTQLDPVAEQWTAKYGARPTEEDVEAMFTEFVPLQVAAIASHADIISGAVETIAALRDRGLKIGSTTGYNAEMMAVLVPLATASGYSPDCMVCVSDVPQGRPAPDMALEAMKRLGIGDPACCVKVGDTVADIHEGLNAKMWSIGVVDHGNEVGLSRAEFDATPAPRLAERRKIAQRRLANAGAHYVANTIRDTPTCIDTINKRLATGERP